jgi:hypothetical protein
VVRADLLAAELLTVAFTEGADARSPSEAVTTADVAYVTARDPR